MKCWLHWLDSAPCEAPIDPAHIGLTKQFLRKHGIEGDDLWDDRIIRSVCRRHHQILDGPRFHLYRHQLPASVLDFAKQHDLLWAIDKADQRWRQSMGSAE